MPRDSSTSAGFTLIELSIVLVIIGLIVGGVLLGQDLIRAAEVRATISQIEKFNLAVNTFRGKYGALPGDMPPVTASQFNFKARGTGAYPGEGDGNGVIEGNWNGISFNGNGAGQGIVESAGETAMFWSDLTYANGMNLGLIEGNFNLATNDGSVIPTGGSNLNLWFPQAKLGKGNYIYVWSGGMSNQPAGDVNNGINYYGISMISYINNGLLFDMPGLTVAQAYSMDSKMDDGLPQSGRVQAFHVNENGTVWAAGGNPINSIPNVGDYDSASGYLPVTSTGDIGNGMAAGPLSCYDGSAGLPEKYSMQINSGAGVNCALSFQFQ